MLSDKPVQAALPATDLNRATTFYEQKLGMKRSLEQLPPGAPPAVDYVSGGVRFGVFQSSGAASGTHTQMIWVVDDLPAEVADLRVKGVKFEDYDLPMMKTVEGVLETPDGGKAAWFKDTEGNLLGLVQMARA